MIEILMDMASYVVVCVVLSLAAAVVIVAYGLIANVRRRMRGEPIKPFRWR